MVWAMVIGTALIAFGLITFVFKAPRKGWEAIGAALLLGIAGFAFQARVDQPGASKAEDEQPMASGAALVEARKQLEGHDSGTAVGANRWMVIADAMTRNGRYSDAAGVVAGAIEKDPRNSEAWVALGNDLVGHAEGMLTPAAIYAYRRGAEANPGDPAPSFFFGLALAADGRPVEGRAVWAELLQRAPADAPWRAEFESRLKRLDAFIAAQQQAQP